MELTAFVVALIVIADTTNCVQIDKYAMPRKSPLANYNGMIDQLIATEGNNTTAEQSTIIRKPRQDRGQKPNSGKQNWRELSTETALNSVKRPDLSKLNSTERDLNNSQIMFFNKFMHLNKSLEPDKDENVGNFEKLDNNNKLKYYPDKPSSKQNLNDNRNPYKGQGPQYHSAALEKDKILPWFNSKDRYENVPTRRSVGDNNQLPHVIDRPKDNGLGVVLKEELVFEIEDDKPTESPNQPVNIRLHTTTSNPKPSYKPKIRPRNMNFPKLSSSTSTLRSTSETESDMNKSMYDDLMKPQKSSLAQNPQRPPAINGDVGNNFTTPEPKPKNIDSDLQLQAEFRKLSEKINTLEEFLNKTLDKENTTESPNPQINNDLKSVEQDQPHSQDDDLRTGRIEVSEPALDSTAANKRVLCSNNPWQCILNNVAPPQIFNPRMENDMPENNPITGPVVMQRSPILDPKAVQRRQLLLELAKIAKLNRDMFLMSNMRKRSKYIFPVPVYRRRVILKPLGSII